MKSKKCSYCGSIEHQILKCPIIPKDGGSTQRPDKSASKQSSTRGSRPKVPARVYTLDYHQVPDSTKIIEVTIPIYNCLAKVLIDPGAIHSFINSKFMSGVDVRRLSCPILGS